MYLFKAKMIYFVCFSIKNNKIREIITRQTIDLY